MHLSMHMGETTTRTTMTTQQHEGEGQAAVSSRHASLRGRRSSRSRQTIGGDGTTSGAARAAATCKCRSLRRRSRGSPRTCRCTGGSASTRSRSLPGGPSSRAGRPRPPSGRSRWRRCSTSQAVSPTAPTHAATFASRAGAAWRGRTMPARDHRDACCGRPLPPSPPSSSSRSTPACRAPPGLSGQGLLGGGTPRTTPGPPRTLPSWRSSARRTSTGSGGCPFLKSATAAGGTACRCTIAQRCGRSGSTVPRLPLCSPMTCGDVRRKSAPDRSLGRER
mmetsp:Transcript_29209/g.76480  ORF Transcript_29209/g.76480 Transcript_29209/m.76480 type:complete len:278 (+) Transcript_29209:182-1015(+)